MALVKCKKCGNNVSTKAFACPKCGEVITSKDYVDNVVANKSKGFDANEEMDGEKNLKIDNNKAKSDPSDHTIVALIYSFIVGFLIFIAMVATDDYEYDSYEKKYYQDDCPHYCDD